MTDAPPPDVHVDAALVRRLVAEQHPDLVGPGAVAPATVELVANGWDNVIFRLGDRYAVRMPRRELGAQLIERELRWLPELAPALPVPVPAPVRRGAPAAGYPYAWSIVPWFEGEEAASVDRASRGPSAAALAAFVGALGAPAPAGAPRSPFRGVPLADRDAGMRERLSSPELAAALPDATMAELAAVWAAAVAAPVHDAAPVWVHGDLHPANLLLRGASDSGGPPGALAAVLDFGDLTAGDPATDLATAWLTFDDAGRAEFRGAVDAAGRTDAATWARARGWALVLAVAILTTTGAGGRLGRMATETIPEVLSDP
ncbi:phosphotransferase [Agromyces sp. LHK192]|uniref:phosphotransferase n=1 Tax=Agromyces sp. LHK192 TaxID=2498704 RepID=UPI000FDB1553|nr:phosphotransferase [Agromyces sp. LHK192]